MPAALAMLPAVIASGVSSADEQRMLAFGGAVVFGIFFILLAERLKTTPIVILLLGGILLGPECLNIIRPDALAEGLKTIVALSVGIILFEGGLSLDPRGYKKISREIKGLMTIGALITWFGTALLLHLARPDFDWRICLLIASLVLVTGPSIIHQLLRRVHVKSKLHHILHWEGILFDPVGVFIVLLCWKVVQIDSKADLVPTLMDFGWRVVVGLVIGGVGGLVLTLVLRKRWIPENNLNIFVLASAIGIFGTSDLLSHESGLLAVTIAGFAVGCQGIPEVRGLRAYKAELIELLIGMLFVLLAAKLELSRFLALGVSGFVVVLAVMFVVRPVNIFMSTLGADLTTREKLFLSWVNPRGLIAASMASLFALSMVESGNPAMRDAGYFLEAFTYSIIAGTVIFQGFTAGIVARLLKVVEPHPNGWIVAGAHRLARRVAGFIQKAGYPVVVIDSNPRSIKLAKRDKLKGLCTNPLTARADVFPELYGMGSVLAVTEHTDLNHRICLRYKKEDPRMATYKWVDELTPVEEQDPDLHAGQSVWEVLQLSALKSMDSEGLKNIEEVRSPLTTIRHPERALLCIHNNALTPYIPQEVSDECHILIYQPFATGLDLNINPEWMHLSMAKSLPELFTELLSALQDYYPELEMEVIHNRLIDQEKEFSSLVGYEVALPHFHHDELDESVVLIAKLLTPLKDQHSGDPIRYVFLVLSPSTQPKAHLNSLSEISRFIMEEENRERLDSVLTQKELVDVFFIK